MIINPNKYAHDILGSPAATTLQHICETIEQRFPKLQFTLVKTELTTLALTTNATRSSTGKGSPYSCHTIIEFIDKILPVGLECHIEYAADVFNRAGQFLHTTQKIPPEFEYASSIPRRDGPWKVNK